MCDKYISKDQKYVLLCEQDLDYSTDDLCPDTYTKFYINETPDTLADKLTDLFFNGDEDEYQVEHDKFTNAADLFNDLNPIAEKHGYWITPIWKYEHGMVRYGIGTSEGWDSGTIGYAFINMDFAKKDDYSSRKEWLKSVATYLNDLSTVENGEVFTLSLCKPQTGKVLDSCSGFFFDDNLSSKENIIDLGTSTLCDPDESKNDFNDDKKYQKLNYWQEAEAVTHVSYVPTK